MTSDSLVYSVETFEDEETGVLSMHVTTHRVLPEHAQLARAKGLDPARVTYAPDGEPWYEGMPLDYV